MSEEDGMHHAYPAEFLQQLNADGLPPALLCLKVGSSVILLRNLDPVTNFIWPYLYQFSIDSHGLNGYGKPLKRPFDLYQSCLEAISIGRDIRQINW